MFAFSVAADDVAVNSPVPQHIAKRFKSSSADEAMPRSLALKTYQDRLFSAEQRRKEYLASRSAPSARDWQRVKDAEARRLDMEQAQRERLTKELESKHLRASKDREKRLARARRRCAQHWRHALHVCRRAERQEAAWRKRTFEHLLRHTYNKDEAAIQQQLSSLNISSSRRIREVEPLVTLLQRAFRRKRAARAADRLRATPLGVGPLGLQALAFPELAGLLRRRDIIAAVQECLTSLAWAFPQHQVPNQRVFLASLMFIFHPDAVFEQNGDQEQQLHELSRRMVSRFFVTMDLALSSLSHLNIVRWRWNALQFGRDCAKFADTFQRWKQRDYEALKAGLVAQHRELSALRETTSAQQSNKQQQRSDDTSVAEASSSDPSSSDPPSPAESSADISPTASPRRRKTSAPRKAKRVSSAEWHPHITDQQLRIEKRLRSMGAGQEAEELEATRMAQLQALAAEEAKRQKRKRTVSQEAKAVSDLASSSPGSNEHEDAQASRNINLNAVEGLTNAALAHEIALDPSFDFDASKLDMSPARQKDSQLLDRLQQGLNEGQSSSAFAEAVLDLVKEIQQALSECTLPRQERLRTEISAAFDLDVIRQQLEQGVFDHTSLFKTTIQYIRMLCAPSRDQQVQAVEQACQQSGQLFRGFSDLLQLLREMHLDLANFLITSFRPLVQQHAVELERNKIKEACELGLFDFASVQPWADSAVAACMSDVGSPKLNAQDVFFTGVANTIFDGGELGLPETFKFDHGRIATWRNELWRITVKATVAAICGATSTHMRLDANFQTELLERMDALLGDATQESKAEDLASFVEGVLDYAAKAGCAPQVSATLRSQLQQLVQDFAAHPVFQVMRRRLLEELKRYLTLAASDATQRTEFKRKTGLDLVHKGMAELFAKMHATLAHNRKVFVEIYDEAIAKAIAKQATTISTT